MVTVGRISRPHGNRGQVVVAIETDFAEDRFRVGEVMYVLRSGAVEPLTVVTSRPHEGRWIVGFDGVRSIGEAEVLRGLELRIAPNALHELGPGGYYAHDLVGCDVRGMEGALVGRVERVELATGVPMLVVGGPDEVLVPFVDAICRHVDVAGKLIEIDPPEGLIDLNRKTRE
jgi:16S rRNA processing protein RimM